MWDQPKRGDLVGVPRMSIEGKGGLEKINKSNILEAIIIRV